ncbi:MAG: T9SS type A sorting domain-containing protein [Candidatus Cloacimonadales bacterium]|nr:T9SS type A sorting domain-containing protein [Candidatus Cloacimonadales bacterium]
MKKYIFILSIFCFSILLNADPPDWQQITGTQYSMVTIAQITFFGNPFQSGTTNMAGAFGPGGETDCRSLGLWQNPNPPYDGYWYFTIVGNLNGENITFKIYDENTDAIYDCGEYLVFDNNATIGSPTDPYQLSVQESSISGNVSLITNTLPAGNILDVEVECDGIVVNPNANGDYNIVLNSGIYDVTASLSGYTTVILEDIVLQGNQGVNNVDFTLIDWEQIGGTQYSMIVMATASISGNEISGGIGNIFAAFGPGGNDDCRAIASWQEPNPPYWDGYWYFTIVGNTEGDEISFKIYDIDSDTIYDCFQVLEFTNNATIGSPEEPFEITDGMFQEFDLVQNWNWISFNLHPEDNSISTVFAPLGNNIYQIKNQTQSAIYYGLSGVWIGDLTQIVDGKGYLVKMINAYSSFQVEGIPIDTSTPIPLSANWNWIAYYPQASLPIAAALASIENNVYQVKDQSHSAIYYSPPGVWTGNLEEMQPGTGYKVFMNAPDDLIYAPSEIEMFDVEREIPMFDPPAWSPITGTEFSMVVMAAVTFDGEEFAASGDNMIGAFGPGGETDCRSVAVWQVPNPPYYDGFWYFTIVGDTNGDEISFMLYDETSDAIYTCDETISFDDNATLGQPDDPMMLTCGISGVNILIVPNTDLNLNVYPNPFNPNTTILFDISNEQIELAIFNLKGQKVRTFSNHQIIQSPNHQIIWNGTDQNNQPVSSGIYFVILQAGKEIRSKKILLLK